MLGLIALVFGSTVSLALPVGVSSNNTLLNEPKNWCSSGCSEQQVKIEEQFQSARFAPEQTEPSLYSGDCFHTGFGMENTYPHKGAFYFSGMNHDDGSLHIHSSGVFGFFSRGYGDMTIEDAQNRFTNHSDLKRAMIPLEKSYLSDYSIDDDIVRYWFRHSADLNTVYLLGQWGFRHIMFCELKRNPHLAEN